MTDIDVEEWTEATDAVIPRADLVGLAANGVDQWLVMKQGGAGLLDPDYVRGLIAKSEPESHDPMGAVTVTGSPAALAEVMQRIHGAPVRKSDADDYREFVKTKYDAADRKRMSGTGAAMTDGSYPIADEEDLDRAIRAVGRGGEGHDAIRRHIATRARSLGMASKIPDTWNSDGSLKKEQPMTATADAVAKDMAVVTGETDDAIDGMDPTVVLAEPDQDAPGDPVEPGSPAWEAIDAATARKWTAIAVRLRNALGVLADRELLEAATADPDGAESAFDLQDAQCCLDCVIDTLAGFAVEEQAEADLCGEAMEQIGKALAGFDPAPLELIEGLAPVTKSGRVLSAANEAAIRGAVESLQKVLASLPQAPTADEEGGHAVAKTANEEGDMPAPTLSADVTEGAGQVPAMGTKQAEPKPVAGTAVTQVAKADGDAKPDMVAVYDEKGNLVGVVDPSEITRIAPAKSPADGADGGAMDGASAAAPAPAPDTTPTDLAPAPSADAGTPADGAEDEEMAKAAAASAATAQPVLKSSEVTALVKAALDDYSATQAEIVKRLETQGAALEERNKSLETSLAEQVAKNSDLAARLTHLENQPAVMAIASNGAVPQPPHLRGQDYGAPGDLPQALALRKQLAEAPDAVTKKAVADRMQELAIEQYGAMRQRGAAL